MEIIELIGLAIIIIGMWGAFWLGKRKNDEYLMRFPQRQIEVPMPELMPDETATEDEYLKHFREAVEGKPDGESEV